MSVKQGFFQIWGKSKLYLKRSSPMLLCCAAAAGVVGTAVSVARAAPKAKKLLEEAKAEKGELSQTEVFAAVAPAYIPSALIGLSAVFCIFGANALSQWRQAQITSAYALLTRFHKEYRETLMDLHGTEADIEVRNAMAMEHCNFHQIGLDVPDGKVIFYEEMSGESFVRYEREVMDAEYHLNRNFALRGYALLNEFYEFLGLPKTKYGEMVGWSISSGICWIDFEHRLIDNDDGGLACYAIDMIFCPEALEEW